VRVFRQFAWLEVDAGKMALSRPAHYHPLLSQCFVYPRALNVLNGYFKKAADEI
jgi:hypothetical protein